jgi:branched-chain amino acid transport system substrate-binding protein
MADDVSHPGTRPEGLDLTIPSSRRTFLAGLGMAALGLGLGACGGGESGGSGGGASTANAPTKGPLTPFFGPGGKDLGAGVTWTHGLNLALTGTGAAVGQAMARGATVATELMKQSGGPSISLQLNDHKGGLVPPAVTGVRRLITQKGISSLGTSYGPATTALFPLIEGSKITTFWSGGAGPAGLNKDYVWITMALFALDPTPGGLAYLAHAYPKAKRLAIIGQQENGVDAVNKIAPKTWPEVSKGGSIVAKELVNIGTKDFSALIARLKGANADAIFSTIYGDDQGYMIKQVRQAGIDVPIMNIDLITPTVPNIAGPAIAKNCYLAVDGYQVENANPYNQVYVKAFRKKYNADPDYFSANFFEATNILAAAIGQAVKAGKKPGRGPELSDAIKANRRYPSVYGGDEAKPGEILFGDDHSATKPIGVFEIGVGGKLTRKANITKSSTQLDLV